MSPEATPFPAPLSAPPRDIDISWQLTSRPIRKLNRKGEIDAMYALADTFNQEPTLVLKRLSNLAIELCRAGSSGVSVLEPSAGGELFRWRALSGEIEQYVGGTTPRNWSPCGECLKAGKPTLFSYPARYFTYFQKLEQPIVEGLVIPMLFDGAPVGTIWVVSHTTRHRFDAEDVRIMASLANFATTALRCHAADIATDEMKSQEVVWRDYMRRVVRHDELALEALFAETYALVFSTASRILSFGSDAEEIAADVYNRVWARAQAFEPGRGTVGSWLVTMARNSAIDRLRARAARSRLEAASLFQCSAAQSPDSTVEASERSANLKQALQALPVQQRKAIELFYFSELPLAKIAALLHQPLGTVKTRLRLARLTLRRLLAALEPSHSTPRAASRLFQPAPLKNFHSD